ncbi:MAG: hypothetical protein FWF57_08580 [Defluviitaleaceae bacterium]|nr:hypothetical protein [Defluviitaleaceae bacterium]
MGIVDDLQNKELIKKDINEALQIVYTMFQERYINKLQKDIKAKTDEIKKNPPKEIKLIQSIKPFIDYEIHEKLDKTLDTFHIFQTIKNIQKEINSIKDIDNSVYEIDSECMRDSKKNTFIIILLIAFFVLKGNMFSS